MVAEFMKTPVFETLERDFRGVELRARRLPNGVPPKRSVGKERLEQARVLAAGGVRALLERHSDLPPAIEAFLRRYWSHHLTLCALRDETGSSGKSAEAVAVGEELAGLMKLDNHGNRSERLAAMRPRLLPILVSANAWEQRWKTS